MNKIINGRKYDTNTATNVGFYGTNCPRSDFSFFEETLYRKKTGEFFLYGEGGPRSKYFSYDGSNTWGYGSEIIPLTETEAKRWAEEYLTADGYEDIFGEVEE